MRSIRLGVYSNTPSSNGSGTYEMRPKQALRGPMPAVPTPAPRPTCGLRNMDVYSPWRRGCGHCWVPSLPEAETNTEPPVWAHSPRWSAATWAGPPRPWKRQHFGLTRAGAHSAGGLAFPARVLPPKPPSVDFRSAPPPVPACQHCFRPRSSPHSRSVAVDPRSRIHWS